MEASNVQPHAFNGNAAYSNDAMNTDMDIDMDIDLTTGDDVAALEAEAMTMENNGVADAEAAELERAAANAEPQPEKIHIRGLDNLTTGEVKAYTLDHFPTDNYVRVEWIDDTSANIVYETAEAASEALAMLTDPGMGDPAGIAPLQLRRAKNFFEKPETELSVRLAVMGDVKAPRAHEASRFYLMNPDKDPREKRRRDRNGGGGGGGAGYNRRRYDDREQRRRKDQESYDVDMYDEDAGAAPRASSGRRGRRDSFSDEDYSDRRRGRRRDARSRNLDDLLSSGKPSDGRLRDRSASPLRDGDGRYGFAEDENAMRRSVRRRSYSPPSNRGNSGKELFPGPAGNTKKELFPNSNKSSTLLSSNGSIPSDVASNPNKELFPHKTHTPNKRSRELFPHKTATSNHRRQDALDNSDDSFYSNKPRTLEERITGGPNNRASGTGDQGFSVKGSAQASGFSIRGAADVVKELFPMKTGNGSGPNAGKELFSEKIKGRGGPRRKAEDMYF